MKEIILAYQGEMSLKGLNRATFESVLLKTMRRRLKSLGNFKIYKAQSTMYAEPAGDEDIDAAEERIGKIFGIAAISRAAVCPKDFAVIADTAKEYLCGALRAAKTFKVSAKRSDKTFPMDSMEIARELGGVLLSAYPHLKVDVHHPDVNVTVEIRDFAAYVHGGKKPGAGGLPVSTSGKAALMLSGGIDSPVAGYMVAKRGVKVEAVYFHAPPYTSERAKQKVVDLARLVSRYSGPMRLHVVNFTDIQLYIYDQCPHEELTIIMRRYMMRIAGAIAEESGALALVTGESIGQVASQTLPSLACTGEVCDLPVIRPVIGFDKQEIVDIALKIDTFETSIQPFEDCCTIFVAKHPVIKPNRKIIRRSEEKLAEKIGEMVKTALETREIIEIR